MHMVRKRFLKVEYNDPHIHASKLGGFPFTSSTNTVGHFLGVKVFDKWPTVLVFKVKRKPRNFEANLCRSLYSTFTISF